ncbi:hypothetical protein [Streptomyces cylindrosporus]|uniref:Uncharacterized protein n=1 Tax=Streptomyces cylindrosporus TaxID=2927583 RepID=A0ABS9YJ70_9ACTN|nr:hypothetical protein [Streptomyces cylindrosporus]MCI3277297.1 hypothetical protein [Streptomyces cylindrosporus]
MELTIDVAVLLAVIIFVRVRHRDVQARSRTDQWLTVFLALAFGVLIAPTAFGQGVFNFMGQLAQGVTQSASP